jgi:hypothetical protein
MNDFHGKLIVDTKKRRILNILSFLERNKVLSAVELSQKTHATNRTIISDIAIIRDEMSTCLQIESTNSGYSFRITDREQYQLKKQELLKDEPLFSIINGIFLGDENSVLDWAELLHHTTASLYRYFTNIKQLLRSYGVRLEVIKNVLVLEGNEVAVRKFFIDYFYEAQVVSHAILPTKKIDEVAKAIIRDYNLSISFLKLSYLLLIQVERVRKGRLLTINDDLKCNIRNDNNFRKFEPVKELLQEKLNLVLNEDELMYLYLITSADRDIFDTRRELAWIYSYYNKNIELLVDQYCCLTNMDTDFQKKICIHSYLTTAYNLYQIGPTNLLNLTNINREIQRRYEHEYHLASEFFGCHLQRLGIMDEALKQSFLVNLVILQTSLVDLHDDPKKKIGVLLEGHFYSNTKFLTTFIRYFQRHHELVFLSPLMNELLINKESLDLVITNYPLHTNAYLNDVNYLLVNPIPDDEDWNNILEEIDPNMVRSFHVKNRTI